MHRRNWCALVSVGMVAIHLGGLGPASLAAQEVVAPPAAKPAPGPALTRLTLEQAREHALGNNKQLQLGQINLAEKQLARSAAWRDYLPKLLGIGAYVRFDEALGSVVTTPGRALGGQTIRILPAGPGLQVPTITVPPQSRAANVFNQDTAFGSVMVAQPITKLIAVSALVDLARADEGIAAAQLDKGTRELLSGVSQAYYGLLAARRIQAALSLQAGMLDKLLQATPTAELRLGLLEVRKGLAEAEKQVAELNDLLVQLLGLPCGTCLELVEPALAPVALTCADQAAQLAVANSPQIREAEQNITKARAGLRVAKMDYLPDVNVFGGYTGQTFADYIQPNFTAVGVTATFTFWDWGKRKQVLRQRETTVAVAHQNVEVVAETVQMEARKAFLAYKQAEEYLRIAREVVKARQDAEKEAKAMPEVLTAKAATAKAQLEEMQAEVNYRLAHAKLLAAIGQP